MGVSNLYGLQRLHRYDVVHHTKCQERRKGSACNPRARFNARYGIMQQTHPSKIISCKEIDSNTL